MSVLADPFWSTKFQSYAWQECQTKCAADQVTAEYAQEW